VFVNRCGWEMAWCSVLCCIFRKLPSISIYVYEPNLLPPDPPPLPVLGKATPSRSDIPVCVCLIPTNFFPC
jgi:hypothetical protein